MKDHEKLVYALISLAGMAAGGLAAYGIYRLAEVDLKGMTLSSFDEEF